MQSKVEIVGNEAHVTDYSEAGEVLAANVYPINLTYMAAILDKCDEATADAVRAVFDAPDISPPAPPAGPSVEELQAELAAMRVQFAAFMAAQKPAA